MTDAKANGATSPMRERIAECDPDRPVTLTCARCLMDYQVRFIDGQRVPATHDCAKGPSL